MRSLIVVVCLTMAAPACARVTFAAWDGPAQIFTGEGGTHVDNHGIDVWTGGRPARRFQVLGVISDDRSDKPFSGDAMNSPGIAKKVREVGGDALVLWKRESSESGVTGGTTILSNAGVTTAFANSHVVHDITTRFVVIKYLAAPQ